MGDRSAARIAKLEAELRLAHERERQFGEIIAQQQTLIAAQQQLIAELEQRLAKQDAQRLLLAPSTCNPKSIGWSEPYSGRKLNESKSLLLIATIPPTMR